MKTYKCKNIRNIVLAGHGASGKTSLAEAMLFTAGGIDRQGRIADGNTVCDYDPDEIKRKVSLNTSIAYAEWKDVKINIIDTPGQFDFIGGMYEGIRAAETVAITLSAKDGVQVGTIKAYREAKKQGKATMFVVTKLDEENSSFYRVLEELKEKFGPSVCPIVVPFDKFGKVESYINLLEMKAYAYEKGKAKEVEVPASENRIKGLRAAMAEAIAETDEELMMRFFENEGEDFTEAEIIKGLHDGVDQGIITPVICCAAEKLEGIDKLLDTMIYMTPSPDERKDEIVDYNEEMPLAAFVFKTLADPFVGKLSFVKIVAGVLTAKVDMVDARTGESEKFGKMLALKGKKQEEMIEAYAGDIVALTKLDDANTGDTLCDSSNVFSLAPIEFPVPCYFKAVSAKDKNDEGKISAAIRRLLEEDHTLSYEHNHETHQRILGGLGEQHIDAAVAKLKNKFGVDVMLSDPTIAYREAIRKKVSVEGKHKKQSGGHGQYGHVKMEFEPHDGEELIFEERVFGGSVPKNFFPAVEKGLQESIVHGVLAGYPVVRLKATLFDGSYHPVDSSEQAFKMAAHLAYKAGLAQASPCLLEPIELMKFTVPDDNTGDIMGIVNKRRGAVLGMNPVGEGLTEVDAELPMAETGDLAMVIRQMTKGMGWFTMEFARYEQLPSNLEAEVIANAPKYSEIEG
ncbi:MAG: elongation factor G [Ruminiclostridium sp.]|nr:elongation factor G [Ruminiclostridium sp.]